jgi:glycosyltransferase involved in cell wall biosynthesis
MPKLTLIGPMFIPSRGDKPTGRPVSFMTLLSELDRIGTPYAVVDSNAYNHIPKVGRPLSALWVMANAKRLAVSENISFHGAGPGISRISSRLLRYTQQHGTRLSVRVFGGAFKKYYTTASPREKQRIEYVLRNVHAAFFQIQEQVEFFKSLNPHTYWFPTNRKAQPPSVRRSSDYARRFVFVGQIRPEKGVREVIELGERLGPSYQIDVFGPMMNGMTSSDFDGKQAKYRGVLSPDRVATTLADYDALLLPTDYAGEGYPGVIIEALSVGVPSIASRHAGIPEIFVDGESGFLVTPRSVDDLVSAVHRLEHQDLYTVREQCLRRFHLFDSAEQTQLFLQRLGVS